MFRTLSASCVTSCTRCIPLPPPNSPFPLLGSSCLQQQTIGIMPAYHRARKGMVSPHQCKEHYIFAIVTKTGPKHPLNIAHLEVKLEKLHMSLSTCASVQLQKSRIHFSGSTLTAPNSALPVLIWPCKDIGEILSVSKCTCKIAGSMVILFKLDNSTSKNQIVHWFFSRPSWIARIIRIYWLKY